MSNQITKIKLNKIIPNKNQPRLDFFDDSIKGLAESIKENGLLQPITVRKKDGSFELIAGERRYRACLYNGETEIDAIVLEMNDKDSAKLALIENLQREDLNAIEEAIAIQRILETEDVTQNELAYRLGYKQSTIANKLRLLKLPDYIKQAIAQGTITERHARALLKVNEDELENVFLTIINRKYNVSKTEEYIKALNTNEKQKGVTGNVKIGINTIEEAIKMCKKAGIDVDMNMTEYQDNVKMTIKFKK